jgi:hypothetical protein
MWPSWGRFHSRDRARSTRGCRGRIGQNVAFGCPREMPQFEENELSRNSRLQAQRNAARPRHLGACSQPWKDAATLNHGFGHCSISPTKRSMIMIRVIKAGVVIRFVTETDFVSSIRTSFCFRFVQCGADISATASVLHGFLLGADVFWILDIGFWVNRGPCPLFTDLKMACHSDPEPSEGQESQLRSAYCPPVPSPHPPVPVLPWHLSFTARGRPSADTRFRE